MAKKISRTKSVDAAIELVINNTDLLIEVFLGLPAASLIRFQLVSKSWLSLISDSEFGITHSRRNTTNFLVSHLYYEGCNEESESWRFYSVAVTAGDICTKKIYWNGSIHWLNVDNFHSQFDVDAERFVETPLPPKPAILRANKISYFGESNGRLFLIQCQRHGSPGFRMLELDMNTHSWSIRHQINLRPLVLEFPEIQPDPGSNFFLYSVAYVKSGPDKKSFSLVLKTRDNIVLYNVGKGKCHPSIKLVCKFPFGNQIYTYGGISKIVHPLMQCLSPV